MIPPDIPDAREPGRRTAAGRWWTRRVWMQAAAGLGGACVALDLAAEWVRPTWPAARGLATAAHFGFMHAMATFACATFMRVGAHRARHAPAFFLGGGVLFLGGEAGRLAGGPGGLAAAPLAGAALFVTGWCVLAWAAAGVDPAGRPASGRDADRGRDCLPQQNSMTSAI